MIVVTTPTGQIGRHVVDNLLAAGATLRLIARDAASLPRETRDRVEVVEGSHGDPAVIERAFGGADAVFWLVPPNPQKTLEEVYLDFARPATEAFQRLGVKRVVAVTALGRGTAWQDRAGLVTASIRMIDMIMASGTALRGLTMPSFMDNLKQQSATIRNEGVFYDVLDPGRKAPMTATRDIGAVAARLLADASWTGQKEVAVLGPEDLSPTDMAAILTAVLGRAIRYQQIPFDAMKVRLLGRGAGEPFAQGFIEMMRSKNEGMDAVTTRGAGSRTPTTFRQWCETELARAG